ncbi:MAG: hypothetical protein ACK6DX_05005 [Acidobacteriota bacterium]
MRSSYREVLRCLLEGVQWLLDPSVNVKVAVKSGTSADSLNLALCWLRYNFGGV